MEKFKTLRVSEIFVPERLRKVDEDHALAIQNSIIQHGQFNPVTVRMTPNGERKYTLVAGAHRYRAIELMDEEGQDIDVLEVKADKDEAILLEIEENLFRNDLSVLDRAVSLPTIAYSRCTRAWQRCLMEPARWVLTALNDMVIVRQLGHWLFLRVSKKLKNMIIHRSVRSIRALMAAAVKVDFGCPACARQEGFINGTVA